MSSAASSGLSNAGLLPASLAALLSALIDRAAMTVPRLRTLSVGSMYSYPPSASPSPVMHSLTIQTSSASSAVAAS